MGIFKKTASEKALCTAKKMSKNAKKQAVEQPLLLPLVGASILYIGKETIHGAVVVTKLAKTTTATLSQSFGTAYKILKIKSKSWVRAAEELYNDHAGA
jgi:hypothetical protein